MRQHSPPHPGETLREDVLPALHISATEFARRLGIACETLSSIMHGRAPISPDVAIRLERAGIGKAHVWMSVQGDYDSWQAEQRQPPRNERFESQE